MLPCNFMVSNVAIVRPQFLLWLCLFVFLCWKLCMFLKTQAQLLTGCGIFLYKCYFGVLRAHESRATGV